MVDEPQMPVGDVLVPFIFDGHAVRGAICSVDSGIAEMLGHRDYPPALAQLIGEALAAMPLMATHLKSAGRINMQFQGGKQLQLLVAQVDQNLQIRGTAKFGDELAGGFAQMLAGGTLALILEPKTGNQHYQAIVPVEGDKLSESLQGYFRQSEQLDTRLLLAASEHRLTGLLLQRLPGAEPADDEYWQHLGALLDTLHEDELIAEPAQTILQRLFHGEELRVFEPRPITLRCQCDHASISGMLVNLGRAELQPVLEERGEVEVICEFCGKAYNYNPAEIETLLEGADAAPDPDSAQARH